MAGCCSTGQSPQRTVVLMEEEEEEEEEEEDEGLCVCVRACIYTKWFKYDRDYLCVNKSQFVPVIFEPPCISCRVRYFHNREVFAWT
jgi:hypothetical protein